MISLFALLDFIVRPHAFPTHIALQTAIALCLLSVGVVCSRPERGFVGALRSSNFRSGGVRGLWAAVLSDDGLAWRQPLRYGLSVLVVFVATVLRYIPGGFLPKGLTYVTYFPAVMIVAILGGLGPGIVATLLSDVCVDYFFLDPKGQFGNKGLPDLVGLMVFTCIGIGMSWLAGAVDRARKKAAEEILRANEDWERTFDSVPEAVMMLDKDFRIQRANRAMLSLVGLDVGDIQGRHCFDLVHGLSTPAPDCPLQRMLHSGKQEQGELAEPRLGKIFDVSASPIWEGGTLRGCVHVIRDITERKRAEAAILAERRRLESVLDSMPVMVCLLTPDYHVRFANRSFQRQFGESRGRKCYEYCFGKSAPCDFCESFKVFKTGLPHDWQVETSDGHVIHTFDFPFVDTDGSPLVLEMDVDITEQTKATDKLRRASSYARSLLEASLDPLVTISREGKVTDANRAAETVTGIERESLIGSDFSDYFTEPEKARQGYERVFAEGSVRDYPLAIRSATGTVIDVLYNATVFRNEAGEVEGVFAAARDITERKRAEDKLRASENRYRTLVENLPQMVFVKDRASVYVSCNQSFARSLGIRLEEYAGKTDYDFFPAALAEKYRGDDQRVMESGRTEEIEEEYTRDGKRLSVQTVKTPLRDAAGNVTGILGIFWDITERKRAEEKLRIASLYTRTLIEASLDPLVTISREGKITDVNEATEKVTGVSRECLIGSDFSNYFTDPESARRGYEQVFAQGAVQNYPLAIRSTAGNVTDVLYNATVFKNEAGEVAGVFAAARDITEKKRAQEAVAAERGKFNNILDVLPSYVALLTPDYHVAFANREFKKRFGESHGKRCYEFLFGRNEPCEICETYKVLQDNKPQEWKWTGPDSRHYDIYDFPFIETDGSFLILEMGIDVTERRQAEQEIRKLNAELDERVRRRTAELEAANRELEAFTYSVSHDLRAPLRHISGFSRILAEEFKPNLPLDAQHHIQRIEEGTRRMGQLVDDLLNLARIGRRDVNLQVAGLKSIVEEVIGGLQADVGDRQVEWKIGDLPYVDCDSGLMKQVFQNLLSNALKFTRPRALVVIEVGQREEKGATVIYVRDNGVGFSMKYSDKLFGVFQRLHRAEDFEGTGVGLATVQRIIQKHGGRIWAEAELDKGATFYFTLGSSEKTEVIAKAVVAGETHA